ncbi:hypothetical protein ACHHV8_31765 [Paenibacillus sp. TAB 01]|uniref:hypothetical protein n=1 Tax=Paenibacillus sp. TAB 01 TaxID=3368988 RepID=UPI0037532A55
MAAREAGQVPYGYEPEDESKKAKGTVWVYDSFEGYKGQQLARLLAFAQQKGVKRIVFYPLHEETLRRMDERDAEPFYRRVDGLEELLEAASSRMDTTIDRFEGKRKKYTPMDTAFRYLADKYAGPHFAAVTEATANKLAAFDSFEPWIKKIRLWIHMESSAAAGSEAHGRLHPRLQAYEHRWDPIS